MYKDPYNAKIYSKQIFSTNKLPVVKEKTNAWYRRVYLIPFVNEVRIRDPFLLEKMKSPQEIKGLAYKCLKALKKLYKNNFIFTYDIDEIKMSELYEELSNPILSFIRENCVIGKGEWCYKFEFDERLNQWSKIHHFTPFTKSQINQYMKEHYFESNRQSYNGNKTYRVWVGLRWKNTDGTDNLNHFNHFNKVSKKVYIDRRCFENPCKSVKTVKNEVESLK